MCLKTTVLISGMEGMKQMPEMSISTMREGKWHHHGAPAARASRLGWVT